MGGSSSLGALGSPVGFLDSRIGCACFLRSSPMDARSACDTRVGRQQVVCVGRAGDVLALRLAGVGSSRGEFDAR